jgi:hypothetical protein
VDVVEEIIYICCEQLQTDMDLWIEDRVSTKWGYPSKMDRILLSTISPLMV